MFSLEYFPHFLNFEDSSLVHWIVLLLSLVILARFTNDGLNTRVRGIVLDIFHLMFFQMSIEIQLPYLILKF